MASRFSEMIEEARLSARALLDYGDHFFNPTVRLGVTGLSRAGKTVFITALITASPAAAVFRFSSRLPPGGSRGRGWRRSPTTRCRASTTRTTSAP